MNNKPSGIVRRVDDLGRVVIPKELRRILRIREGDPLELSIENGGVFIKKYSLFNGLEDLAQVYVDSLYKVTGNVCVITDRDTVVASCLRCKKALLNMPISSELERIMNDRNQFIINTKPCNVVSGQTMEIQSILVQPILVNGEVRGTIVLAETDPTCSHEFGITECKLLENVAYILGEQMSGCGE